MRQGRSKVTDDEILNCYNEGKTLHETAVIFNMTVVSMWRRAKKANVYFSKKRRPSFKLIPLDEILKGNHPSYQTFKLRNRLIKEGIKENKCEECGIEEWNGKPISIQLDHMDGDSHNHRIENLRMMCPNCHSQTETYCGRNINK